MSSTPLFDFLDEPESKPKKKATRKKIVEKADPELVETPEPMNVTAFTQRIKGLVEANFQSAWVVGQVSNLSLPRSGHIYLTLKDEGAQLPAVLWKTSASKLKFRIEDGMEVVCRGRLDVYPPQGKYQMIVTEIEPKGVGTLELAFRQLHDKLAREGLFDPNRKKPLPRLIRRVAVITSPSGAAIRDFLQVLGRRTRLIDVLIVPVRVQGDGTAEEVAEAIRAVHRISGERLIDCIVVTRGGGSTEDLWAFNEEPLVRAVAGSRIPVVSGVGHEIDVTLCDLAADVRALTPSEAAERISTEDAVLSDALSRFRRRFEDLLEKRLRDARERLRFLEGHPVFSRPERMIEDRLRTLDLREERLDRSIDRRLQSVAERFGKAAASLEALSPLAVLARGYSLTETENGRRVRSVDDADPGDRLRTRLADGVLESVVSGPSRPSERES